MKNIVYARVDDRLVHGQVMTAWGLDQSKQGDYCG